MVELSTRSDAGPGNLFFLVKKPFIAIIPALLILSACGKSNGSDPAVPPQEKAKPINDQAKFAWIYANIIGPKCLDCHSANQGDGDGLDKANFDSFDGVMKMVTPLHPETSRLYVAVESKKMPKGMDPMPGMPGKPGVPLSVGELQTISDWITLGAPNN